MALVVVISLLVLIEQFWWNWWVNFAVAVGTIGAVLVALFGDWAKAKLFAPRLALSFPAQRGELTREEWKDDAGAVHRQGARYYHVRVSNTIGWPIARDVQIMLTRLEDMGPNGGPRLLWGHDEGVPLRWRFQEIHPLLRTIGRPADADLCSVRETGPLRIHPVIFPFNLRVAFTGNTDIFVTLQARSNEGESPIFRLRLSWDGQWNSGEAEMAGHLIIREEK